MLINKAFKSEIHINDSLKSIFNQFLGNRRFIFNQLLSIVENRSYSLQSTFDSKGKKISIYNQKSFQSMIPFLDFKYDFLSKSHSQSNQEAALAITKAFSKYFKLRTNKNPDKGKPQFKRKHEDSGFSLPNQKNIFINFEQNSIYVKPFDKFLKPLIDKKHLNSFNKIFFKNDFPLDLKDSIITGIIITKSKKRFFLSINYKFENNISNLSESFLIDYVNNLSDRMVGIDLGLKDKLILSSGKKYSGINNDLKYKELIVKQKSLQKLLSKKVNKRRKEILKDKYLTKDYKSINKKDLKKLIKSKKNDKYKDIPKKFDLYKFFLDNKLNILEKDYKFSKQEWKKVYKDKDIKDLKKKIFNIERKLTNKRDNENHHISKEIVDSNDFIFMENLTLKGMQSLWGNKVKQLALSKLMWYIKYKAENQGKIFYKVDRFYPSTKECANCSGKKKMTLKDRVYECKSCGHIMDRDINAAINILLEGIRKLIIEKELNPSMIKIGDLKDYIIGRLKTK